MKDFVIPQQLSDLEKEDRDGFAAVNVLDLESFDTDGYMEILNAFSSVVVDPRCYELITEQVYFDHIYSIMKFFSQLPDEIKGRFTGLLLKAARGFVVTNINKQESSSAQQTYRNALYMYIYFISLLVKEMDIIYDELVDKDSMVTEKGRKKKRRVISGSIPWGDYLYDSIEIMLFTIRGSLSNFFSLGVPDGIFLQLISRSCLYLLERKENLDSPRLIEVTLNALSSLLSSYPQTTSVIGSTLITMMISLDHVPEIASKLVSKLYDKCNENCELVSDIVKEITKQNLSENVKTNTSIKNLSSFLTYTSEEAPFALLRSLPLLLTLFDRESYTLRLAVIGALGNLIEKTSTPANGEHDKSGEDARRMSRYSTVMNKRASVVMRRQSMIAANKESEAKEDSEKAIRFIDLKTAVQVLELLEERLHDTNAFVRSAALKVFTSLCCNGFIPLSKYVSVTKGALERVKDKGVLVRKNAIQLLMGLLENNPYESKLDDVYYKQKLDELKELLKSYDDVHPSQHISASDNSTEVATQPRILSSEEREEQQKLQRLIDYYTNAYQFSLLITESITPISQLLTSKTEGDVVCALKFFPIAVAFQVKNVEDGLRRMLLLVWVNSPSITKELIDALKCLYFCPPNEDRLLPPNQITANLIRLLQGATLSETTSFCEIIPHLVGEHLITTKIVDSIWSIIYSATTPFIHKRCALYLLSMICKALVSLVNSNINRLLSLNRFIEKKDYDAAKYVFRIWGCQAKNDHSSTILPQLISYTTSFLVNTCITQDHLSASWYPAANEAMNMLFALCKRFDTVTEQILQDCIDGIFVSQQMQQRSREIEEEAKPVEEKQSKELDIENVCIPCLKRFTFMLGHFAIKLYQFCDALSSRAKKARHIFEEGEQQKKNRHGNRNDSTRQSTSGVDDDIELVTTMDDYEDAVMEVIGNEGIVERNLIGQFGDMLKEMIINKKGGFDEEVQKIALISFSKFMCISHHYCEENINLLFTLLVRSTNETIRSNIIISIGDLCYRFPNLLEQWNSRIYNVLSDESDLVKANTLSVLSHLILNDMIRVKGQIALIVVLLEDPSPHIQSLTKVFFTEWGKRGSNPIYNILPECISYLLEMVSFEYEKYCRVIKYLFHFVDKEKQQEQLIDKLLQRFSLLSDSNKYRRLAYCLTCIPASTSFITHYLANKKQLKDALQYEEVYSMLNGIISKMKRNAKPEQLPQIDEFRAYVGKLEDYHPKIVECSGVKEDVEAVTEDVPSIPIGEFHSTQGTEIESQSSMQKRSASMACLDNSSPKRTNVDNNVYTHSSIPSTE